MMDSARYPQVHGHRTLGLDKAAAEFMAPKAPTLRAKCLDLIKAAPGTPEEIATRLQATSTARELLTSTRSRLAELKAMGPIVPDGTTGLGESLRCRVARYRAATVAETKAFVAQKEASS